VRMRMELIIRFDYGSVVPWVRKRNGDLEAWPGLTRSVLRTKVATYAGTGRLQRSFPWLRVREFIGTFALERVPWRSAVD
jgi:hypothetical protein